MRIFPILVLSASLATLGTSFPHYNDLFSRDNSTTTTCRIPVTYLDYSAKSHEEDALPFCAAGEKEENANKVQFSRLLAPAADDYTCAPDRPCANEACCPKETLSCNYGEKYCGKTNTSPNDVCWSNCDAKAECGKNAGPPGKECPLNVCCSKWGFCGMVEEFCKKGDDDDDDNDDGSAAGCQSNCDQPGPKDKASDPSKTVFGYYEAWRYDSVCQGMGLNDIPVNALTHLVFSFGYITPNDFNIAGMDDLPYELFSNFTALKKKNPGLKTIIALGGWTFNDPGPTQKVFSNMASSKENRSKFIENLLAFMRQYSFDGVDFDWEYPGAKDRGGVDEDGKNFVTFLKELDNENKKQPLKYVVSFTAPSSYWYLKHFDLKAVDYVDFINVMTYDLHGVWDRDNPIGSYIYGHTNLTEINNAFNLFWRNNVPAKKLNMGIGFYGRSFQLEDPKCDKPGCRFKGGATKGACSGESGILSYREIQKVIKEKKIKPIHDKKAGVKYITFNGDQWVSFDDEDTLDQKKELAKDLGLGGYLIWAIDQDDADLSALQALLSPKSLNEFKDDAVDSSYYEDANIPDCYITDCNDNCKAGFIKITEQKCGKDDKKSKLCCPLSGAPSPDDCTWRGTAPLCNGHCNDDEVMLQMNKWGDGKHCNDGHKAFCCKSPLGQSNQCYWAGVGKKCNKGDKAMTFSGTVISELANLAEAIVDVVGSATPIGQITGDALTDVLDLVETETMKLYCCPEDDAKKWTKCDWHGKPGSCYDNHCNEISQVQLTDSYFGAGETCGWKLERVRVFCCDAVEGEELFLPVPLEDLFKNPPTGDGVDTEFDLELDENAKDDNPSDAGFQFVVLTSPDELGVSLDKRDGSHWDVFNCNDAVTEGEHTVQMVCTDFSDDSNCHKIHLGHGAPGTILQMPKGCGPGKYAVAKSMEPAPKRLLPRHLSHLGSEATVYDLTFDYDFLRVPRDLGNTQMRIDFSNQDNYWDEIVAASATDKKKRKRSLKEVDGNRVRWLEEEFRDDYHFGALERMDLEKRWFGSKVIDWLKKMVSPEVKVEFTHDIDETFTAKIVDEKWDCQRGDTSFEGHLTATALTNMNVATSFGFTLIVTSLIPPLDISQSYLTFYNKGEVSATLTLEAVAQVYYEKEMSILTLPFPGASFRIPGIVTIGPQLHVSGSLAASLAVAATFETKIDIAKWEVRQTLPDAGDDGYKPKEIGDGDPNFDKTGDFSGIQKPEFYAGVQVQGDVTAKLSAAAEFGIRFDDSWDVGAAAAAVVGEGSVMVKMGAGVSTTAQCPFTYGLQVGARLYAEAEAPKGFNWPGVEYKLAGWKKDIIEGGTCPDLGVIPTKRSTIPGLPWSVDSNATSKRVHGLQGRSSSGESHSLQKRAGVYGPAFHIPVGKIFCPADETGKDEGSSCEDVEPALDKRDSDPSDDEFNILEKRLASKTIHLCGIEAITKYPSSGDITNAPAYGFAKPSACGNYEFGLPLDKRVRGANYDTEHVLEAQLPKRFLEKMNNRLGKFDHPDPDEKDGNGNPKKISFCDYFDLLWDIPEITIDGNTRKPAEHIAAAYPTENSNSGELIVLQNDINSNIKEKAWGSYARITDTSSWKNNIAKNKKETRAILKTMRLIIGLLQYHSDPTIQGYLRAQKERVGDMFRKLDTIYLKQHAPKGFKPWKTLDLASEWNRFMKSEYIIADSKAKKIIVDFLPELQQVRASQAVRDGAEEQPGDSNAQKASKKSTRDLIADIDALSDKWNNNRPVWGDPF